MHNGVLSYLAAMARPWFKSCKSGSYCLFPPSRSQSNQVILFAAISCRE